MRKDSMIAAIVIFSLLVSVTPVGSSASADIVATYTEHGQITIYSDEQFTSDNGVVSGNGTYDNPYIIEGWDIDISDVEPDGNTPIGGIQIGNTYSHFVIRNVRIHGDYTPVNASGTFSITGNPAIVMYFGANARIENCELMNTTDGIMITGMDGVVIRGNTITGNSYGMRIDSASDVYIEDNYISHNQFGNVDLSWISYSIVKNNTITYCDDGMSMNLYDAEYCDVLNNTISYSGYLGLNLGFCRHCNIKGNTISNHLLGITMYESEDTVVEENTFSGNVKDTKFSDDDSANSWVAMELVFVIVIIVAAALVAYLLGRKSKKPELPSPPPENPQT